MSIRFERTRDYALIKAIVTHPKLYSRLSDDYCVPPEQWEPNRDERIRYVLVTEGHLLLGLFMLVPTGGGGDICMEIHTALLPCAWGERASRIAEQMKDWLWANTPCQRLITNVPAYNRLALRFALKAGMEVFGVNAKSYQKFGKLHDQIMLGISRE